MVRFRLEIEAVVLRRLRVTLVPGNSVARELELPVLKTANSKSKQIYHPIVQRLYSHNFCQLAL
jgi:hypothetical protein